MSCVPAISPNGNLSETILSTCRLKLADERRRQGVKVSARTCRRRNIKGSQKGEEGRSHKIRGIESET